VSSDEKILDPTADHDCVTGSLLGLNSVTNSIHLIPMFCHKWSCPRCRKRKASKWRGIAQRGQPERFITLTLRATEKLNAREQAHLGKKAFARMVQKIRREFGKFEYLLIWELTKKGTPHIHLLQRGTYIPKQRLSDLWCEFSGSFIVDIKSIKSDGDVYKYITKYMGKSIAECSEELNGLRILQKSKNYCILPEKEDEPGDDNKVDVVECWYFCRATPSEVIEYLTEDLDFTVDEESRDGHIILRGPPVEDILFQICHHFDGDHSYI